MTPSTFTPQKPYIHHPPIQNKMQQSGYRMWEFCKDNGSAEFVLQDKGLQNKSAAKLIAGGSKLTAGTHMVKVAKK